MDPSKSNFWVYPDDPPTGFVEKLFEGQRLLPLYLEQQVITVRTVIFTFDQVNKVCIKVIVYLRHCQHHPIRRVHSPLRVLVGHSDWPMSRSTEDMIYSGHTYLRRAGTLRYTE